MKKALCSFMVFCLVVLTLPFNVNAASTYQKAMFLFHDSLYVSCNVAQHGFKPKYPYRKPIDIVNRSESKANAYAPFDCKVVAIDASQANTVVIESLAPVEFADGTIDYMTIMVAHDNDISDLYIGETFNQGDVFYQQGNKAPATGNHIHMEIARGAFSQSGTKNPWAFVRGQSQVLNPYDALFLYPGTDIKQSGGYNWVVSDGSGSVDTSCSISFTLNSVSNLSQTDAKVNGTCSYSGTRPTSVGVYIGTSTDSMSIMGSDNITFSKNPFNMWYLASKYGWTLTPGTTYYYKFYAIVNGQEYCSDTGSFTTLSSTDGQISLSTSGASDVTQTNAKLNGTCSYSGSRPSSVGVYVGTSTENMSVMGSDNVTFTKNPFNMWYLASKYGWTLTPGTTYYYQFYAIVDGQTYKSNVDTFTTSGNSTSSQTSISDGTYTLSPQCANGKCLDVAGGEVSDGTNIQIYTANGTDSQKVKITSLGNGYYQMIFVVSGKSMDVLGGSGDSGINVQQYTWNDSSAQHWLIQSAGDGYYYIINQTGGKYLDVGGGGSDDGTNVQVYDGNQSPAQKWILSPA